MWWLVVVAGVAWCPVCFVLNTRRHRGEVTAMSAPPTSGAAAAGHAAAGADIAVSDLASVGDEAQAWLDRQS